MSLQRLLLGKEDNHILPFFWQHGEDEKTLRHYVRIIHEANIGAFCVESRPHPDFCGPQWWADMDAILDEARKLKMKVWILDDSHFPTGYANGAMEEADPSLCRQSLTIRVLDVLPDGTLAIRPADYKEADEWTPNMMESYTIAKGPMRKFDDDRLEAIVAFKEGGSEADILDLTDQIGEEQITFKAPGEGSWKIAVLNLTRNRGPHRNYINMMDKESCHKLIEAVYEPHWAHYQADFGKTIAGFFSDEPEIGNGHLYEFGKRVGELTDQAWSRNVAEKLQERWQGNYRKYLPFIFDQNFDKDLQAKVRTDYMDVVTRLVEECFSFQLGNWCRAHKVEYIGHLIEDNHQHTRTVSSLGHYFRGLAGQDMAGIDDIGGQIMPQGEAIGPGNFMNPIRDGEFWHYTLGKLGASMGAIDPLKKGRTMCEAFGAYGWGEGVRMEKYIADHLMVRGVNYFVPHAFSPKEFPDPDCPPHFYAHGHNPQFRHFGALMKYMNRITTLISEGKAVIPAAILYNAEADWSGDFMYLQKPAIELYDHQIDYHFIPADAFVEEKYQTKIGKQLIVNDQTYEVLIIPYMEYIPEAAAKAVITLSSDGFPVIFVDGLPKGTCENGQIDPKIKELEEAAAKEGGICVLPIDQLADALVSMHLTDAVLDPASSRIRIYHYYDIENFYYLVNEAAERWEGDVILPISGPVSLYDAWQNEVVKVFDSDDQISEDGKTRRIHLALDPSQSLFLFDGDDFSLRLGDPALSGQGYPSEAKEEDFSASWQRSLAKSLDYPRFGEGKKVALPDQLAEEEPKFSGFVRYEKELKVEGKIRRTYLEITDAYEGVEVFVNGESLGIQIIPTFRYDLTPYLRAGMNQIRIEVATTLEREAADFPNPWALALGAGKEGPKITTPSGINGNVQLIIC